MNKFQIIDNFLEVDQYKYLHDLMTNDAFPWFYQPEINYHHTDKKDLTCYFTHTFYNGYQPNSNFYDDVKVFVNKLEMKAIIRIKGNCYPRTHKVEQHKDHVDYPYEHRAAIYYINDCNGFTILEDGKKIQSKANRLLLFEGHKAHRSTSTTNAKARFNINFNFFV
jgi:hypothetical protein